MCGIWSFISNACIDPTSLPKLFTSFMRIKGRGPESFTFSQLTNKVIVGFHRLAIHGLTGSGNQPFIKENNHTKETIYCVCNGEIYNYQEIVSNHDFLLNSFSDCEVIPFLYLKYGEDMINFLDGEFAFLIISVNHSTNKVKIFCGRDPYGVRPLFYGLHESGIVLGSEAKSIVDFCEEIFVFPPGHTMTYESSNLHFNKYFINKEVNLDNDIYKQIYDTFTRSVKKRLSSERPIGCLLSGGLDSSIVSAVTAKLLSQPLHTFTIGLEGATDIYYAEMVAKHIGSIHQTFIVTVEEALLSINQVIYQIESYDCTTVRASVWQHLLGTKLKKFTDIKVLLTGEGSDELTSGYLYFHNAPTADISHEENLRLLEDIHRFDGLRVDRAMSCHGLEVRIPFLDPEFVNLYLSLPKELRVASRGIEKQLFRDSFSDTGLLPKEVLYRKKEAFSDGTSSTTKSWFEHIQEYIDKLVTDEEFFTQKEKYLLNKPDTKEKYYYRKIFESQFGSKSASLIPYYWLPKWCGDITEPSARTLDIYTK